MREGNTMEVHSIKIVGKVGGGAMANCYSYPSQIHTFSITTRIKASPKMVFQVGSIFNLFFEVFSLPFLNKAIYDSQLSKIFSDTCVTWKYLVTRELPDDALDQHKT